MRGNKQGLRNLKIGSALWKSIKEFMLTTYVHAYHYLVDADRRLPEKLMWMSLHITTIAMAIAVVTSAWARFTENPTITTLETQHFSIYEINFPAIAICPNNKLSKKFVMNYASYL